MQFEKHCSALLPLVKSLRALHVNQNSQHTEVHYPGTGMQRLRLKNVFALLQKGTTAQLLEQFYHSSHWAGGYPSHRVQVRSGQTKIPKYEEARGQGREGLVYSLKFRQCSSN